MAAFLVELGDFPEQTRAGMESVKDDLEKLGCNPSHIDVGIRDKERIILSYPHIQRMAPLELRAMVREILRKHLPGRVITDM